MSKYNSPLGLADECRTFLQIKVNVYQTTQCHIPQDGNLHINYMALLQDFLVTGEVGCALRMLFFSSWTG